MWMEFDHALPIEVAILAATELNAADNGNLGCGAGRMEVAGHFDELAAVAGNAEADALNIDDVVLTCVGEVRLWVSTSETSRDTGPLALVEVRRQRRGLACVLGREMLFSGGLDGLCALLGLFLKHIRVDKLHVVAICCRDPRA